MISGIIGRVTDCNILFLVDRECSLHKNHAFTFFLSSFVSHELIYFALDFTRDKSQIQKFAFENLDFPWRLFYSDML